MINAMRHSTDFERPIDWLAARGLTSSAADDPNVYGILGSKTVKNLAKAYKKKSGKNYNICLNEIVQALGFKNFSHYQDHMMRKGEYKTHADIVMKKSAKKKAKRQAREYSSHERA